MKKIVLFITFIIPFCYQLKAQKIGIQELFFRKLGRSLISRGDNVPDFQIKRDSMDFFLFALHNEISVNDFQVKAGFNNQKMGKITIFLESKNWLHKVNNEYKPTIFIVTQDDGVKLYDCAKPISLQIAKSIEKMLPYIKTEFNETDISQSQKFEEWSFFILSNVLLDNWHIINVENKFLGTNSRPHRHGKYYYASLKEKTSDREAFGIYGNLGGEINVYGNNRYNSKITKTSHYISKNDNRIFSELADTFFLELLKILQENKEYFKVVYNKLGYSNEITFEEFFIWWYHFIYTQTTDLMKEMNVLNIPNDGNFAYRCDFK